jgi:hypothetical protein
MAEPSIRDQLTMDPEALYREDQFSDQRAGHIRKLTPVTPEGEVDTSRPVIFVGQTQVMTPAGALPLSFELPGNTVGEAAAHFAEEAEKAIESTMEELKRLQREAQSSIVVPGQGGPGGPGGGPMGKIQLK